MSQVRLVGGPKNGTTLAITHGDEIEFPAAATLKPVIGEPIKFAVIRYRRSLQDRHIFEYQP